MVKTNKQQLQLKCFITSITLLLLSVILQEALRLFSASPAAAIAWLATGFPVFSLSYQAPVITLVNISFLSQNWWAAVHIWPDLHRFGDPFFCDLRVIVSLKFSIAFFWISSAFSVSLSCCLEAKSMSPVALSSLETNFCVCYLHMQMQTLCRAVDISITTSYSTSVKMFYRGLTKVFIASPFCD